MTVSGTIGWPARVFATATIVYACILVFMTHYPKPGEFERFLGATPDKTLHFLAYGVLAMLSAGTLATAGRWVPPAVGRLAAALAALGVVDEATQPLFSRAADPLDWVYDCVGIAAGLAVVAACMFAVAAARRPVAPRQ
jgi:VanZ family protein